MVNPNEEFLNEKAQFGVTKIPIVQNGKVKFIGYALRKMLQKGPPKYYIAWSGNCVIYDFAYNEEELLDLCLNVAVKKRLISKQQLDYIHNKIEEGDLDFQFSEEFKKLKEVGFSKIHGNQLHYVCVKGGLKAETIVPQAIYESEYRD